jgi:O-succinylbenzoate synthase
VTIPGLDDLLVGAVVFGVPLRVPFRGLQVREGMLIEGPSGWGEFAPFNDYDDVRAGRWLHAAIEAAWGSWPDPIRDSIEVNAIVPEVDPTQAGALTREAVQEYGCRTIKVKVGNSLNEDEARVVAVRNALDSSGIDGRIRLDANAAWSLDRAREALKRLVPYGLEYVEQPCANLDDNARLRSEVDVPIAVDEAIRSADDPREVRLQGVADYAICKPMTLGGVAATKDIVASIGVPVVVSGSLDTGVGLSTCIAAAACLPDLPLASGLGTGALFASDLTDPPLLPSGGRLSVRRAAPDRQALLAATVSAERSEWWRSRLGDAYRALSSGRIAGLPLMEG